MADEKQTVIDVSFTLEEAKAVLVALSAIKYTYRVSQALASLRDASSVVVGESGYTTALEKLKTSYINCKRAEHKL